MWALSTATPHAFVAPVMKLAFTAVPFRLARPIVPVFMLPQ